MPQLRQSAVRNGLLSVLAADDFARLAPSLEAVALPMREVVIAKDQPITYAWFVESGLVSLLADSAAARIEIGMVGTEGMVGVPVVLGTDRTPHVALVQAQGTALRIAATALHDALDASPALRRVLGHYVQSLLVQVGQTVRANSDLNIEERLARWILMTQDRLDREELPLTHDFLSTMLGVRRPGVTIAIQVLEGTGMIQAKRGRIIVRDREKLMELAGEAYGLAEVEHARLFGQRDDAHAILDAAINASAAHYADLRASRLILRRSDPRYTAR